MNTKQYLMRVAMPIIRPAMPLVRLYWRIAKPKTYGVKVVVIHPEATDKILLVRHAYGDQTLWNMPGGGYNPKKETTIVAALREVREELGVELTNPVEIGTYETSEEGKRDTVSIVSGSVRVPDEIKMGPEIKECIWENYSNVLSRSDIARVVRRAIPYRFGS